MKDSGHYRSTFRLKRVTPHVLRHTAAMQLPESGVDRTIIALWLGHEEILSCAIASIRCCGRPGGI
ncbi:tyrosine-type recombinase/integrase [Aliiroseovarius sediminilitoris]|uniref:tyrosine-type recombinase/integrase n=1 Tax=Aliiroseovarius sediminilitoris TaxID=1173584 RepID=UPI000B81BE1B|nr:tyrosine-type recombinase/integrase [Aliiroseovarius sediminilitoris]